ncbi:MAG: S8 family serine peptidase, partial [Bacteroidales bacterium]|nr:S8 family serine peptidase [Bacteroidales bacterium]
MKPLHQLSKGIIILLLAFLSIALSGQEVIRIKFNPSVEKKLQDFENSPVKVSSLGYVKTGMATVDKVLTKYKGTELKRLYRPAGKFEARHQKYGLHLWYELKIGKTDLKSYSTCIKELKALSEVSVSEARLDKQLYSIKTEGKPGLNWIPNDPRLNEQWHYWNTGQTGGRPGADIRLFDAWDIQQGTSNVVVAITDGGIDYDHVDLAANMWVNQIEASGTAGIDDDNNGYVDDIYGYGFADNTGNIQPDPDGHGTHVAGTVGAVNNNGIGVAGIAGGSGTGDGVRLMSCAVFGSGGGGAGFEEAYVYAADMGAAISQNSWGYTSAGSYEQSVLDAIDYFIENAGKDTEGNQDGPLFGGIVIFAAGNSGSNAQWYPGYYPPVLAVASTTHNDTKAWYSNYGPWVDVSAPGGETSVNVQGVLSTLPNNNYGFFQGTSMACPHVSGLAALLVSEYGGPGFTNETLREIITTTTDTIDFLNPSYAGMLGTGRINAFTALSSDDSIPPSPISDLSVFNVAEISVSLNWTATGNDTTWGRASVYDLRYSTSLIDESNFESAARYFNTPAPQVSGSLDSCTVSGLTPGTTYYFALKAADVFGNISEISNVVSATTLDAPIASVSPTYLSSVLDSGNTEIQSFTLSNTGQAQLNYAIESEGSIVISSLGPKNNTSAIHFSKEPKKGEPDFRVGHPVITGAGEDGPDGFGYRWIDSDEAGGPAFSWQDISSTSPAVYLDDDDYVEAALPFAFNFYDSVYHSVFISSNGYITFTSDDATDYSNDQIPNTNLPNLFIAPFWDDLYPPNGGAIYYQGDANKFIVQYQNIFDIDGTGDNTFQVILSKDGSIKIQYLNMNANTAYSTIGIENHYGTEGLQVAFNTSYIHNNLAIQISKGPQVDFINSIAPASGSLAVGESVEIQVEISSDSLVPGNYQDHVMISSNDPLHPVIGVPVNLHVNGMALVSSSEDSIGFDQVFLTDTAKASFQIVNTGSDSLIVSDIISGNPAFVVLQYYPSKVYKNGVINVDLLFVPDNNIAYLDTLIILSNAANSPVQVILTGEGVYPPVISVSPDSLSADLYTDQTETQVITI